MKLITFQSMEALKYLINNEELICDDKYMEKEKREKTYNWIVDKMNSQLKCESNIKYPIWCWVKCYNGICPPKVKGEPVADFKVKITFNKKEEEVFITDFRRYSFLLNNMFIPNSMEEKEAFDKELEKYNITKEDLKKYVRPDKYKSHRVDEDYIRICNKINKSFDRCITKDSNILQGCVWKILLSEVEKIEILPDDGYRYGSINYKRANGKTMNWRNDFYKSLKEK